VTATQAISTVSFSLGSSVIDRLRSNVRGAGHAVSINRKPNYLDTLPCVHALMSQFGITAAR
jgi:hypothetical protein